jgi:outer membrane protein OmpA-like peptidoglycan-associated protein
MRILLIGFIAFVSWSALSTYVYVCKIKGFCNETATTQVRAAIAADTLSKPTAARQLEEPGVMTTYFDFDESEFKAGKDSKQWVDEFSAFLSQNQQAWLIITGHTDRIGTKEYNQALGQRRAQSMVDYFSKNGLSAKKILVVSKGETEPIDVNSSPKGRANNRRTVITIKK